MKELVGKKITRIRRGDESTLLAFETEGGETVAFIAEGDCCSFSWFEHLDGVAALLGGTVRAVEEREMPPGVAEEGDQYVQFYGYSIRTDRGRAWVEFRNESNGYYGGWVRLDDDPDAASLCTVAVEDDF